MPDTVTSSAPNTSSSMTPVLSTSTINILHQNPTIKPFPGQDYTYSAITYLTFCEDAMCNSSVTFDSEKISFIHSNLVSGLLVAKMMQPSAFDSKHIGHNYAVFRKNFFKVSGLVQQQDFLQWIFHLADSLTFSLGSLGHLRA